MDRARTLLATGTTMVALSTLAGCNPFVARFPRDTKVEVHGDGATMAAQWNATLAAPAAGGGAPLAGVATATPALGGAGTYVHVSLTGAPPGATYRWRLRAGSCAAGGAVVGAEEAYGSLAANDRGHAAATATIAPRLASGARYHVRVGDPAAAVACGDMTPPTR